MCYNVYMDKNIESNRLVYWLGQRDMVANIFMMWRESNGNDRKLLESLANLYNTNLGGNTEKNCHVEFFLNGIKDGKS